MSDAAPTLESFSEPPRRDRRIVVTAALSGVLHVLLLGWMLWPRTDTLAPLEPPVVNVELERPSEVSPVAPSSSEAVSSEPPAQPAGSAAASSEASAPAAPVPQARPIVIPVGPSEASSDPAAAADDSSASANEQSAASEAASSAEASSAASAAETASLLATSAPAASDGIDPAAAPSAEADTAPADAPRPPAGTLHAARRSYLADMLGAPQMAKVGEALKTLPKDKRLAQSCNIEAIGQLGNAGRNYEPDALVASAFAKPVIAGMTYAVGNGAFRSKGKWIGIAYECTLSKDFGSVASFTYRLGGDVTEAMQGRAPGRQKP